jgi:N-acetylneuraminic acid mutarotase
MSLISDQTISARAECREIWRGKRLIQGGFMNASSRTPALTGYRLSLLLTAGVLGIVSCREDASSPTEPKSEAVAAAAQASNTWVSRASAPFGSLDHYFSTAAAPNATGQWFAYTFGGRDDDEGRSLHTTRYNVQTNTWNWQDINSLVESSTMNGVGKIGNKFYMTGGAATCCSLDIGVWNALWVYDIAANKQTRKADLPRATMFGQTGVIDNRLYVLAGYCSGHPLDPGHCVTEGPVKQFYRYDPATNTWILRHQPPHIHTQGAGAVIIGKFYVVGANPIYTSGSGRELDVYDPSTNAWTSKAPIPTVGGRFSAAVIQNRMFVIVDGPRTTDPVRAYSYDPVANSWRSRAAPPVFEQIVRVQLNGQARLFLPASPSSYLYAP